MQKYSSEIGMHISKMFVMTFRITLNMTIQWLYTQAVTKNEIKTHISKNVRRGLHTPQSAKRVVETWKIIPRCKSGNYKSHRNSSRELEESFNPGFPELTLIVNTKHCKTRHKKY